MWTLVIIVLFAFVIFRAVINSRLPRKAASAIDPQALIDSDKAVTELLDQFDRPFGKDLYLTHSMFERWLERARPLSASISIPRDSSPAVLECLANRNRLNEIVTANEIARASRNAEHVHREARRHSEVFSRSLDYPLNPEQVAAILHDEDRCVVVAGAGTGKTSTIVGKVLHVIHASLARPDEILLLAFTKKAAEEMEQRLAKLSITGVKVKTFHALGVEAIAHATGKRPSLSKLAEDKVAAAKLLNRFLKECLDDPATRDAVTEFIAYHRYGYRERHSFASAHQYHQHMLGNDIRTLRGEQVKSLEECLIANWLTLHDIRYEYEQQYEHETASIEYRQYQPDFYLPERGVYIEHFALDSAGRPPEWFGAPQRYLDGIEWKRALHKKHRTILVETFSRDFSDGSLFSRLEESLRKHGVSVGTIAHSELQSLIHEGDVLNPVVDLLHTFLTLYKGNGWTPSQLRQRADASRTIRAQRFVSLFEIVLGRYEAELQASGTIDFNDMIAHAVMYTQQGRYSPGYKYILVDEFQDISHGRARLLTALLAQVKRSRLFVVGDDWQSIYRFTGSDIDLMTRFSEHFGFSRRTDLCATHRFSDRILKASSLFIQQNPQQLKKNLVPSRVTDLPGLEIVAPVDGASPADSPDIVEGPLERVLNAILQECREPRASVLVMGRYHATLERYRRSTKANPRISLVFSTVHQAKGSEADYAIVLDVVGGRGGFPSEIVDDALLDLVLAGRGSFPNAEERRLFYVAITRARHKTFLITEGARRSAFIDELEDRRFEGLVIPSGAALALASCPSCKGGRLRQHSGPWGEFWGCSSFPLCKCKVKRCPSCGLGPIVREPNAFHCKRDTCRWTARVCPRCGIGALVLREGRNGKFWGCTEWRPEGASCRHTQQHLGE